MKVETLAIPAVKLLVPERYRDARGFFSETYSRRAAASAGIDVDFVQDNQAASGLTSTIRGLHFQTPPHAQAKLVRCTRGSIFDVAVDLRRSSPTYGRHVSAVLTADKGEQIWVPHGFAHGYCTLEPDSEVLYKVDAYYAPSSDAGLRWDDPAFGIDWPLGTNQPVLSDKDRALPLFSDFMSPFA